MSASLLSVICLVLIIHCQSNLAYSSEIQRELEVIKGQLQSVIDENKDLRRRTAELEDKVDWMKRENNDLEQKMIILTKENIDLKKRTITLERKVDRISLGSYEKQMQNKSRTASIGTNKKLLNHPKWSVEDYSDHYENKTLNMHRNIPYNDGPSMRKTKWKNDVIHDKKKRLLFPVTTATTAGTTVNANIIAFSARVKNIIASPGHLQEIPFETVMTNIGQAFHGGTGTFSCPQNGVYAFFLTILTSPNTEVQVELVKDGVFMAYAFSTAYSKFGTGSTSAIIRLQKGDKVWVREHYHAGAGNMIHPNYTSFMGFSLMLE